MNASYDPSGDGPIHANGGALSAIMGGGTPWGDVVKGGVGMVGDAASDARLKDRQEAERKWQEEENARNRDWQGEMESGRQDWQTGEREGSQDWRTGERQGSERWQTGEREGSQRWQTGEREGSQDWASKESGAWRDWTSGENERTHDWERAEREASERWQSGENAADRSENRWSKQGQWQHESESQDKGQNWKSGENRLDRAAEAAAQERDIEATRDQSLLNMEMRGYMTPAAIRGLNQAGVVNRQSIDQENVNPNSDEGSRNYLDKTQTASQNMVPPSYQEANLSSATGPSPAGNKSFLWGDPTWRGTGLNSGYANTPASAGHKFMPQPRLERGGVLRTPWRGPRTSKSEGGDSVDMRSTRQNIIPQTSGTEWTGRMPARYTAQRPQNRATGRQTSGSNPARMTQSTIPPTVTRRAGAANRLNLDRTLPRLGGSTTKQGSAIKV